MTVRIKLYHIIDAKSHQGILSKTYNIVMIVVILASIVPLFFKESTPTLCLLDSLSVKIFIVDYLLRWSTADLKLKRGVKSFFLYPFTAMAIIDLLSIVPSLGVGNYSLRVLRLTRLAKPLKVLRMLKLLRYSKNFDIILATLRSQKQSLIAVSILSVSYVFMSALIVFNVEPQTFQTFFDAVYWAVVSLTTVGYGDIYAVSVPGRIVAMVSSFVGIAIIALPAGIITAGYIDELKKRSDLVE